MHFDIKGYIENKTDQKITVKLTTFKGGKAGSKTAYKYGPTPEGSNAAFIIRIDSEIFSPATEKVAKALMNLFHKNERLEKEAKKVLKDFIDRAGSYAYLKEYDQKRIIQKALEVLTGVKLETLAYAASSLMRDTTGNITEMLYEDLMNSEDRY